MQVRLVYPQQALQVAFSIGKARHFGILGQVVLTKETLDSPRDGGLEGIALETVLSTT